MTAALVMERPAAPAAAADAAVWACLDDLAAADAVRAAALPRGGAPLIAAGGLDAAFERLEQGRAPRVIVVGIDSSPDPAGDLRALAARCGAETRLIALGAINDVALYRALRGAGAADYLVLPADADALGAALDDAFRTPPRGAEADGGGPEVVAVTGALGGAGASTLAVNAAWHLAAECGRRVALVDLDAQFGRAALSLDLEPSHGMREIFDNPERIDSLFLAGALLPARAGLWVLGGEEPLDAPLSVTAPAVERLLEEIGRAAEGIDTVVLDVPRAVAAAEPGTLARARVVALVTELSLAGIRDTGRLCERIAGTRDAESIEIVVGKVAERSRGETGTAEFERCTGRRIAHTLPWDAKALARAGREGKALAEIAPAAPLARAIARVAESLAGTEPAPSRAGRLIGWMKHAVGQG